MRTFPLASYSVLEPLRVGGLSQSHLAERQGPSGRERVVLKQLLPAFSDNEVLIARWLERAEQNAALAHPGCVRVLDWGRCNGEVYVALEHVEGVSLKHVLRVLRSAKERVPVEVAVYIARVALEALAHGHELVPQLLHLDVSPYSLIIRPDGSLVLTEFGMWSALDPAEIARLRFDRGRVNYVAPEQAKSQPGDARSDVFSVGVLLQELLVGERPFSGATQLVVAMAIADNKRKLLREVAPSLPPALCEVVEHLLAHKPDERFQGPRAALNALTAVGPVDPLAGKRLGDIAARAVQSKESSGHPAPITPPADVPEAQNGPAWAIPASIPRAPNEVRTERLDVSAMRRAPSPAQVPAQDASPPRSPSPVPPPLFLGSVGIGDGAPLPRSSPVPPPMLAIVAPPPSGGSYAPPPLLMPPLVPTAPPVAQLPYSASPGATLAAGSGGQPDTQERPPIAPPVATIPSPLNSTPAQQAPSVSPPPSVAAGVMGTLPAAGALALPPEPFVMPREQDSRWHDPSKTLFQVKQYAKGATARGSSKIPLGLAVALATVFGFAVVAGGYLFFRLFR